MSTSPEVDGVRPRISSTWTQPIPPRADENIKLVQRKIDQNLKLAQPGVTADGPADRMWLPGSPALMAQLAQPRQDPNNGVPGEPADPDDAVARAQERRMASQWENVTARLLRDFAPTVGSDVVLAHIAEQRTVLDSATVRDYLPVLVERAVRKLLTPEETGN
ncbi:three-helix bundle dimerization domain-containing protein [Pseudonocardia xinjiangensis]|uniref:three-helix bundle dimerization domain-containing protein n=1 Tax=Pseudonocardia xinjiangensis TaxID=75289 RepID=UPI003D9280C8